jgi:hypothetical protein
LVVPQLILDVSGAQVPADLVSEVKSEESRLGLA